MDELIERITAYLWRVYGYPGEFGDAHPVTIDTYRANAAALVDEIEQTYVLVPRDPGLPRFVLDAIPDGELWALDMRAGQVMGCITGVRSGAATR